MADKFEELRTFVAIAEAGGVNAAAATLGIARSAVSRRLSDLEARLGATLVERSTRSFELTGAGRTFEHEARRLLADLAGVEARAGGSDADGKELLIAIDGDLLPLIAAALASFASEQSGVSLTIGAPGAETAADVTVSEARGAKARLIGEARRVVVASPVYLAARGTPVGPSDLGHHDCILVNGAPEEWTFRRGVRAQPRVAFRVQDSISALRLALAGAGVAHIWEPVCQQELADGSLERLMTAQEPAAVRITVSATSGSPSSGILIDHLMRDGRQDS